MTTACEKIREKVLEAQRLHAMFPASGGRILTAVSGGADSVCLLHILSKLGPELRIKPVVAHLNHATRGAESDADEAFVRELAGSMGLECVVEKLDACEVGKAEIGSLEAALRELRYGFLCRAARDMNATRIATGHNADDNVETILFRIIRGAAPSGAAGMEYVSGDLVRPLLGVSRAEIEDYCRENGLQFRVDSSNADPAFTRNRIRRLLLPLLESEFNPRVKESITRFAALLREDTRLLEALAGAAAADCLISKSDNAISFRREPLAELPAPLLSRIIRNAAAALLGPDSWRLDSSHIEAMADLCSSKDAGRELHLPASLKITAKYETVEIEKAAETAQPDAESPERIISIREGETELPGFGIKLTMKIADPAPEILNNEDPATGYFDLNSIAGELKIRYRKSGDTFQPLGLEHSKKLSDFFIDERIDREARDRVPLLVCGGEIAWVVGHRIDNRFRVTGGSVKILEIMASKLPSTD